jgi:hypothetical protein
MGRAQAALQDIRADRAALKDDVVVTDMMFLGQYVPGATTDELLAIVHAQGFVVDEGNLISGPFIPDGRVRIYDPETNDVLAQGRTIEEALADCPSSERWR